MKKEYFDIHFRDTKVEVGPFHVKCECPHCGEKMLPEFVYGYSDFFYQKSKIGNYGLGIIGNNPIALMFKCVACSSYFVRTYKVVKALSPRDFYLRDLDISYSLPIKVEVDQKIKMISSKFETIYQQSLLAKGYGLHEIYGMGLRKAVEFLAKDFAIYSIDNQNPEKDSLIQEVKKKSLNQVIKEFFSDEVADLFTGAAWIGNDETHYDRKHPDIDSEYLENAIKSLMTEIKHKITVRETQELLKKAK